MVTVNQDDQTPLREEITDLLFAIAIGDATNKDLAWICILREVLMTLSLVLPLRCGEAHVQRTLHAREVLHIYHSSISVGCKFVCCERIRRLRVISSLRKKNFGLGNVAILRKVIPHFLLSDAFWQTTNENLEVLPHC